MVRKPCRAVVAERARIRWAMARGDIDDAARRIEPLIANIEARGRQRLVAQLKLLQALIERRRGRADEARQCTLAALRSGHRLGLVRSLLDADPAVMELVGEVAKDASLDPVLAFYAERLGSAGRMPPAADATVAERAVADASRRPVEPLSERERDVLGLLVQAMPSLGFLRRMTAAVESRIRRFSSRLPGPLWNLPSPHRLLNSPAGHCCDHGPST